MWFWLSLLSALLGAVDIFLNKKSLNKVSAGVLSWALFTLPIPFLLIISFKQGIPSVNSVFWLAAIVSSLTFVFSKTIINEAFKQNLMSKILPLTAFSGVFTYFFGLVFLSESLRLLPVLGLLSILFGSYILNVDQAHEDILKPFKLLFLTKSSVIFLIALMVGALTAVADKTGLNNTNPQSPIFILLVTQIMMSVLATIYILSKERKTWVLQVKQNFWLLFLNSLVFMVVSFLVFAAYGTNGPVALVLGVKRLQIFFVLILGYLFLKDKPTKHSWIATAIMMLGVLMIKLG